MKRTRGLTYVAFLIVSGWLTMGVASCPTPSGGPSDLPRPTATATAPPVASPTATAAVTAAATPTTTPAPAAIVFCVEATASTCEESPTHQPIGQSWIGYVRQAMQKYQAEHPDQFDHDFFKFDSTGDGPSQDVFMAGIAANLRQYRLDACIDQRGGDLIVSSHAMKAGEPGTFAETYHPISGWDDMQIPPRGRLVQAAPYLGKCSPRWF